MRNRAAFKIHALLISSSTSGSSPKHEFTTIDYISLSFFSTGRRRLWTAPRPASGPLRVQGALHRHTHADTVRSGGGVPHGNVKGERDYSFVQITAAVIESRSLRLPSYR